MKKCIVLLLSLFMISTIANAQSGEDASIHITFDGYYVRGTISGTNVPSDPFIDINYYFPQDTHDGGYGGITNPFPGYTGEYEYINTYTIGSSTTNENNVSEFSFPIYFYGSHTIVSFKVYLRSGRQYQTSIPVGYIF